MKTLVASLLLLSAGSAAAHNACNMDLGAGVRITDKSIEFYRDDQQIYKIVENQYLVVKGQVLKLSQAQQDVVTDYAQSIRTVVPQVHSIAVNGIEMAIQAITITFDGLLGQKNQVSSQLISELSRVRSDVDNYFTSGQPINFNKGSEGPDFLGKNFEARIERIVEASVEDSVGSIMIAMGKEIISSGGDMEAFSARMEKFGAQIETQMNAKAATMEERGNQLCGSMRVVEANEEQLRQLVPAVATFDVIQVHASAEKAVQQKI